MRPQLEGLQTIHVRLSDVGNAIEMAKSTTSEWQAELIEILLIPSINKRWMELNNGFYQIERHAGIPYIGFNREDNMARGASNTWREISGYTLSHPTCDIRWNSVREEYYGHSAGTTWDGIRRETYHSFADALRNAFYHYSGRVEYRIERILAVLEEYKIDVVNDIC